MYVQFLVFFNLRMNWSFKTTEIKSRLPQNLPKSTVNEIWELINVNTVVQFAQWKRSHCTRLCHLTGCSVGSWFRWTDRLWMNGFWLDDWYIQAWTLVGSALHSAVAAPTEINPGYAPDCSDAGYCRQLVCGLWWMSYHWCAVTYCRLLSGPKQSLSSGVSWRPNRKRRFRKWRLTTSSDTCNRLMSCKLNW